MKLWVTCRHHAIYVEDEWTLAKVYPYMFACLFHTHGGIQFALDLAEGGTFSCVSKVCRKGVSIRGGKERT